MNTSNYTGRINEELSDRIGYPTSLIPLRILPTGVYSSIASQQGEIIILQEEIAVVQADLTVLQTSTAVLGTSSVLNTFTDFIFGTEPTIFASIAVVATAAGVGITKANNAQTKANTANTKVDDLIVSTTTDKGNTSNYISNTSNIISTRIKNLPAPQNFVLPTASSGTSGGIKIGENININNGVISTSSPFRNIMTSSGSGQFQVVVNAGTELNNPTLGKLFITTVGISVPEIVNNTMKHHLEVNGTIKIIEATGTVANANNGSIVLDHENNGGSSSITFRSKANRGSNYGYIQYQDASVVNGCGESARLIIGTQNDVDNHIIFAPSGNVGIGNNDPTQKLIVQGNIQTNGAIYATSDIYAGPAYNGGFYSGHSNWGFEISNFSGQYWTEARGYWNENGRGFRCFNIANNSVPFVVHYNNCVGIGIIPVLDYR